MNSLPKQRLDVEIIIPDELIDNSHVNPSKSARGVLSEYANSKLRDTEDAAWEKMVIEKY